MNTKVRFVRCPRCQLVLPELADVPVYECGGCGTILQAKNQKKDTSDAGSLVHEADPTQKNGLGYLMCPSTDESDLEKILGRCGSGIGCRKQGINDLNWSHKYHTSDVISCHENTGSLPEISGHAGAEEDELPLVQYGTQRHNELGDDIELPEDTSAANKILSAPELNRREDKLLVHGPENLSPRKEEESPCSSENINYGNQIYSENHLKELPTSTGFSEDLSSCYESCEDGALSSVSGTDREVDESLKKYTNSEDKIRKARSSPIASEAPDNQTIPLSETTKQAEEETSSVFQRVSSADTSENIPQVYATTELGVTLISSTAKHYYDYGVNTSCPEIVDELPSQNLHPSRENFKDAESRIANGMPKREELVVNYGMNSENKLPPRPTNSLSTLSAKKHYTTKGSEWSRGEFHEDKSLVYGPENPSPRKEDGSRHSSKNISYEIQNCLKELPASTDFSGDLSSCYESCEDGDLSSVSGTDREVDESLKIHSNPEKKIRKAQSSFSASKKPDNRMIPLSELMKQAGETFPVFQRVSSADTLVNIPRVYARTDLGVTLRSSTAKHYYDYGASTSCVETEDELPSQHIHASRKNFKDAEPRITNGMPKRDKLVVNYGMSNENKLTPRPINSLATLSAKKHYSAKGSKWSRGEFQELAEHRRPFSSKMTMETGENRYGRPFYLKGSQVARNGNYTSSEPKGLPARTVDPESKTQLLRIVYELQDQLKRVNISKGMPHGRYSGGIAKKEHLPAYSNLFAPNGERYPDLRYTLNPGRHNQVKTYLQHGKVPRMAFSGDAAHFSHEVDCSCLRCYRQKWHYSTQLPRHAYYDEGHSVLYCRGPRHSSPSLCHSTSAAPYQSSEFPWSHDTTLDVIIHQNNNEVKKKQQAAKQHFRPVAGAAPIIVCYCCNAILQLPADFLLLKRKCHRLRCSACTVVLRFSLEKGIHIVEYNSEPRTPPPSEVGEYTETTNLASASCAVDYQLGDAIVSACDGKNVFSEIEEVPAGDGSPLHQLMGYPSPRYVI
ncbi:hypothetical protein AgCh_013565 [Apium graveolens]